MGDCQSIEEQPPSRPNDGGARPHQAATNNNNTRANKRQANNTNIESLVRVGSKVLKPSGNDERLQVARASTYDHVHNVVLTNFETFGEKRIGVVGLRNLGNTCFMNSALQCLSNTIPLTDYFLGYDYRKEINYNNVLGTKGQLVNAYTQLMKQIWLTSSSSSSNSSLDPSFFYSPLVKFAPDFSGGQQHDAQELLAFLLDGIHEDLNRVVNKPYIEDVDGDGGTNDEGLAVMAWQNYLLRNRSIVVDLFQGQLRNTIHCCECNTTKVKFEPFMYLSLPISPSKTKTLDECLDLFCETETLSGDNQWYCSHCAKHVNATKKFDLWMLPPILIIHLKRFNYRGDKIETPIQYPIENWNLKSKSGGVSRSFDLYAVSNHSGGLNGGHYTAMVKNRFDDTWYEMNDSSARRVSSGQANPKAYCLFYNRVDTSNNGKKRSDPKIMRQSVDRPELWPHMQLNTSDVTSFRRSTVVRDIPPAQQQTSAEMTSISEENEVEA